MIKDKANYYEEYVRQMQQIANVHYANSLLQWDHEVYLPAESGTFRARQIAALSGIEHRLLTDESLFRIVQVLLEDPGLGFEEKRNVVVSHRDISRKLKYDSAFVETLSETASHAFLAWDKARKENDFELFSPWLQKIITLKQQEAELLGYDEHPYDALLEEFEPGMKASVLDRLFTEFKPALEKLLSRIREAAGPDNSFMYKHYERNSQWEFGLEVLRQMGYDFRRGRQDISSHPFTITLSPSDVRITTRIAENDLNEMIWSCLHEGGHALYEQGLPERAYGLPAGEAASLGIHESQSRLWENNVGRGLPFWEYFFPLLQQYFPQQLGKTGLHEFYAAMNKVRPSLIRTNADELTYHFHIIIRYEIEKELISGMLRVKDLPGRWSELYKQYIGLAVPDDASGVLQDVHWSHGSIGYFPTYSLGSLYAAQFYHHAQQRIPGLEAGLAAGNSRPLLDWLRQAVHVHGRLYTSEELCALSTGEALNINYFMDYATRKYAGIYALTQPAATS